MRLRCRTGDLAIVIYDEPGCESNIGRILRVRGPIRQFAPYDIPCWHIRPVRSDPWRVVEPGRTIVSERVTWKSRVCHPDAWLLPLRENVDQELDWTISEAVDDWLLGRYSLEELQARAVIAGHPKVTGGFGLTGWYGLRGEIHE